MKSHKQKFYLLEAQVALALTDKIDTGCGTDQRGQRQYGRFSGNAQEDVRWLAAFTQEFLRPETFVCRMLPPLRPWPGPRPGPVELRSRTRSIKARTSSERKYYTNIVKDLMNPANAGKLATRRFELVLRAMDEAKRGGAQFLLPVPREDHRGIVAWWSFLKWLGPRQDGAGQGQEQWQTGMAVHSLQFIGSRLAGSECKASAAATTTADGADTTATWGLPWWLRGRWWPQIPWLV